MITKAEITNFRGIKHLELGLTQISIIAGKNDIGKSTALNAINWLITNKLLTDKYGEGENDIQSIIPNDHRKGEHTAVSIWLDTGTKYTKILKRGYERSTGKVNKHETEYLINDGKVETQKEFYSTLNEQLVFTPKFTKLKVDEVRLFTDPLYALLKLDYKELRSLLVAMGCTVSNEELYKMGFEDMKPYGEKYLGKWDVMRKNLKVQSKELDDDIKRLENQLQLFSGIGEFNDSKLKELQTEKEQLIQKKNELRTKGISDLVSDIDNEKTKLTLELEEKRNNRKLEYNSQIKDLEFDEKNIITTFQNEKAAATSQINEQIVKKSQEILEKKTTLADFKLKADHLEIDIKLLETKTANTKLLLGKASEELGNLMNGESKEIICPVCGSPIDIHESEHKALIEELSAKAATYENEVAGYSIELNKKKLELGSINLDIETLNEIIRELTEEQKELQSKKLEIEREFVIDKKASELREKIIAMQEKVRNINLEFEEENKAINELEAKRNNIILENQKALNDEAKELQNQIDSLDAYIKEEYTKQNDYERKCNLEENLDLKIKDFNNNESLLARCNSFIKMMCKLINDKAKQITGFDFILLEENLTNDGISEVCYIVDEKGIPFKDINTARKTIMGIQFIESCRRIAGDNSLPILADRLEGLDTENLMKLKEITQNQIICTKVSDGTLRVEEV